MDVASSQLSFPAGDVNTKLSILMDLFPKAPVSYLESKAQQYAGQSEEAFVTLIEQLSTSGIDPGDIGTGSSSSSSSSNLAFDPYANPTPSTSKVDDFIDLTMTDEDQSPVTASDFEFVDLSEPFDVVRFIDRYDQDPFNYFEKLERDEQHGICVAAYLKDRFRTIKADYVDSEVVLNEFSLIKTADALLNPLPNQLIDRPRLTSEMDQITLKPISFLLEVEFYEHKQDVLDYMEVKILSQLDAKLHGELMTCECCSEDELLPYDVMTCSDGHIFCQNCIKRYVEVRIGEGATDFPCLQGCPQAIPFKFIERVLPLESYNKLMARIQEIEVKKADISGIEFCCACEYGAIPAPEDLVLLCVKCGVETCRGCKKRTHVPFKCGETAKDDQMKQDRKKSEEILTMQVVRKCPKCWRTFVKAEGCDKITCQCGCTICYRCGKDGIDYNHFAHCSANANNSPWSDGRPWR